MDLTRENKGGVKGEGNRLPHRGRKVGKKQDKALAFEWNLKILSKIRELTEKKKKRRKIP